MSKRRAEAVAMMNAESNKFRLRAERAEATIERVRELHWPNSYSFVDRGYSCGHCGHPYPCDTIRALDGLEGRIDD